MPFLALRIELISHTNFFTLRYKILIMNTYSTPVGGTFQALSPRLKA